MPKVVYQEQLASTATNTTTSTQTDSTGAATGAVIGGLAGLASGAVVDPPGQVNTYVTSKKVDPVCLEGEVLVGSTLPSTVKVYEIPDYQYRYTSVNGQTVLVEPCTSKVVHIYR